MNGLMVLAAANALSATVAPDKAAGDAGSFIKSDLHLTRYKAASVNLNGDGVPEVLVYANGPEDCGSGGCDLYVLAKLPTGFRTVTRISITRLPVRVMSSVSNGWHDLGVQVAGGGILHGYEARLRFDGQTYPNNPTVSPAKRLSKIVGRVVID